MITKSFLVPALILEGCYFCVCQFFWKIHQNLTIKTVNKLHKLSCFVINSAEIDWISSWTAADEDDKHARDESFSPCELQFSSSHISTLTRGRMMDRCPVFVQDLTWINEIAGEASEFVLCFSSQVWCNTLWLIWLGLVPADRGAHLWPRSVV